MSAHSTALVILPAEAGSSLLETAEMEFQATLQLLLDRACWISGASAGEIALQENRGLRYVAVSGASVREAGTKAAADEAPFRHCLTDNRVIRTQIEPTTFCMAIPISQDGEAIGYVALASDHEFGAEAAVSRVTELIAVALQHREAARRAEKLEFRDEELELPSLWSAPENVPRKNAPSEIKETPAKSAAAVATCAACGFPISPTRSLCVECEQKQETPVLANNLFQAEAEEGWLSAHGYTIASLIVTALTAAILLWLRH